MFGFYYAIAGLIFGALCSKKAKEKGMQNKDWFTLGFALNIFAYILILIIPLYNAKTNEPVLSFQECGNDLPVSNNI